MASRAYSIRSYKSFGAIAALCLILLYAPLVVIAVYSFNASKSITLWEGVSLVWYIDVFTSPENQKFRLATFHSFTIAIIAATVATTIATLGGDGASAGGAISFSDGLFRVGFATFACA